MIVGKITSFQLPPCPSSSKVDSLTIPVLAPAYFPSLSSHDATKYFNMYSESNHIIIQLQFYKMALQLHTCSKVICLVAVSFSNLLIFLINLLTCCSCSCSNVCSSLTFSCRSYIRLNHNTIYNVKVYVKQSQW